MQDGVRLRARRGGGAAACAGEAPRFLEGPFFQKLDTRREFQLLCQTHCSSPHRIQWPSPPLLPLLPPPAPPAPSRLRLRRTRSSPRRLPRPAAALPAAPPPSPRRRPPLPRPRRRPRRTRRPPRGMSLQCSRAWLARSPTAASTPDAVHAIAARRCAVENAAQPGPCASLCGLRRAYRAHAPARTVSPTRSGPAAAGNRSAALRLPWAVQRGARPLRTDRNSEFLGPQRFPDDC